MMPLVIAALAFSIALIIFFRLPLKRRDDFSPSNDRPVMHLTRHDALPMLLPCILSAVLFIPVLNRLPDDQRLLAVFSPDFSRQVDLAADSVRRGSFDLNIPNRLEKAERLSDASAYGSGSRECWRWGYGSFHINLTIGAGMAIKAFGGQPSFRTLSLIHSGWLLLFLFAAQGVIYLWARVIGDRWTGMLASGIYMLPYLILQRTVHATFPDHIQQAVLLLSLSALALSASPPGKRSLFAAAFLAGAAFGIKYLGMFIFPLLFAAPMLTGSGREAWCSSKRRLSALVLLAIAGFSLGFAFASPQAVIWPKYFAGSFLETVTSVNYSSFFTGGVLRAYWKILWERLLFFDAVLLVLILAGGLIFLAEAYRIRNTAAGIFLKIGLLWISAYSAALILRLRYYEFGVFFPLWPFFAIFAALSLRYLATMSSYPLRAGYKYRMWADGAVLSLLLAGFVYHEAGSPRSSFAPVLADRRLLFNVNHPFYGGIRSLAGFLKGRYGEGKRLLVDYSQVYVPADIKDVSFVFYAHMARLTEKEIDGYDVIILTRKDSDFAQMLDEGVYDREDVGRSRALYGAIRSEALYRKAAEFDYPGGWLTSRVEVWERKR